MQMGEKVKKYAELLQIFVNGVVFLTSIGDTYHYFYAVRITRLVSGKKPPRCISIDDGVNSEWSSKEIFRLL